MHLLLKHTVRQLYPTLQGHQITRPIDPTCQPKKTERHLDF